MLHEVFYKAFVEAYNAIVKNRQDFITKWKEQAKSEDVLIKITAKRFIDIFKDAEIIEEFDVDLFFKLVEKITIFEKELLIISLLDGTELEVEIE